MQRVIERILNLLAFLLTVNHPVTAEDIRHTVAGYDQDSDAAFRRTFERDKDLLRSLGVPLKMTATDIWEVEHGYVIREDEYAVKDPGLTDEERSALLAAAQVVQFGGQPTEMSAIFKLGGASSLIATPAIGADLGEDLEGLGVLFDAIASRREVRFAYGDRRRTVHPYALAHRLGHWYLAAPERKEPLPVKAFRVDRMTGIEPHGDGDAFEVPANFDSNAVFPGGRDREELHALVRFAADVAPVAQNQVSGTEVVDHADDWVELRVPVHNRHAFIGWMLGFDDRAVVLEPAELRESVIAHVRGDR